MTMALASQPEQLDFDESEFFDGDDLPPGEPISQTPQPVACAAVSEASDSLSDDSLAISDCSSSDDEYAVEEHLRLRLQSLQSSLTQPTPMEDLSAAVHSTSHGSHVGSLKTFGSGLSMQRGFGSEGDLAASMPVAPGYSSAYNIQPHSRIRRAPSASAADFKLGTSMPIGIPLMHRRSLLTASTFETEEEFVPPHLVEQESGDLRDMFRSLGGLSPNAAMKRDRLAQRNSIMRATGFLETSPALPAAGAAGSAGSGPLEGLPAEGLSIPPRHTRVPTQTSSLSAALGLSTTPR